MALPDFAFTHPAYSPPCIDALRKLSTSYDCKLYFPGNKKPGHLAVAGLLLKRCNLLEQLGLVDEINVCTLEACPLLALFVIDRVHKALPVLFVNEVLIHAVVETGIT